MSTISANRWAKQDFLAPVRSLPVRSLVVSSLLVPALFSLSTVALACDSATEKCTQAPSAISTIAGIAQVTPADSFANDQRPYQPTRFALSTNELNAIIHRQPEYAALDQFSALDEILVTAPHDPIPMKTDRAEPWGGLLAPFWAISHPTQAWRIFFPVLTP